MAPAAASKGVGARLRRWWRKALRELEEVRLFFYDFCVFVATSAGQFAYERTLPLTRRLLSRCGCWGGHCGPIPDLGCTCLTDEELQLNHVRGACRPGAKFNMQQHACQLESVSCLARSGARLRRAQEAQAPKGVGKGR